MQLRDYPQPLLAMTEVTISGRMLFAEQEAQERGSWDHQPHMEFTQLLYQQGGNLDPRRLAVVEVGQPWGNTIFCRKLPPLKCYYCDLEMGRRIKLLHVEVYTLVHMRLFLVAQTISH